MVAPIQFSYRCPRCGNTFAADDEGAAGAGCPGCRESPGAGWYLKVRGEIVGPVPFESLPDQINASAVLVRQSGETDWTPVTSVLPELPVTWAGVSLAGDQPAAEDADIDALSSPARRLIWPLAAVAFAVVVLASGWVYHRVTVARAESRQESDASPRSALRSGDRRTAKAIAENAGDSTAEFQKQLAASEYRRHLLAEVTARQARQLAAQIQDLKAITGRSRRFRRFRGDVFPPDEDATKTLMNEFRRKLSFQWAAVLARRKDAAAGQEFLAAEIKRITGAPVRQPLQTNDLQLLKQNGVKYRTRYNEFYPTEHRELTLYMEYGTAEEIARFAAHAGLEFPTAALPSDFVAAIRKLRRK